MVIQLGALRPYQDARVGLDDRTTATRPGREIHKQSYCISIVHGEQPELRGTLDVELDLIALPLKRVAVVGGTLSDHRIHECVVDALEVTRHPNHPGLTRFTLEVRAPKRVAKT